MRIPQRPPSFREVMNRYEKAEDLMRVMGLAPGITYNGVYVHWDRLRRLKLPEEFDAEELWASLKLQRFSTLKRLPFEDADGNSFTFAKPDSLEELQLFIDQNASGRIEMPDKITNPQTRDRYVISGLIEEAIRSSQLEGAATTRAVAADMIRSGRAPLDLSERMILNNYQTMRHILDIRNEELTPELVFEIHQRVTESTLDDPTAAGRLREPHEEVKVYDIDNQVLHTPPPAYQLDDRLASMCDFANGHAPDGFLHPVLRAVILHFWLAYDHPFVDGNGRTARALFYWSMLKSGYWLCQYISISRIMLNAPAKYARSFLYTETDENDLTYFILYHLSVIKRAIGDLHLHLSKKSEDLQRVEQRSNLLRRLNHRQKALITHALRHPRAIYTISSHQMSHEVAYETARKDLLDLHKKDLLVMEKSGRVQNFYSPRDLEKRLSD